MLKQMEMFSPKSLTFKAVATSASILYPETETAVKTKLFAHLCLQYESQSTSPAVSIKY